MLSLEDCRVAHEQQGSRSRVKKVALEPASKLWFTKLGEPTTRIDGDTATSIPGT